MAETDITVLALVEYNLESSPELQSILTESDISQGPLLWSDSFCPLLYKAERGELQKVPDVLDIFIFNKPKVFTNFYLSCYPKYIFRSVVSPWVYFRAGEEL